MSSKGKPFDEHVLEFILKHEVSFKLQDFMILGRLLISKIHPQLTVTNPF